MASPLLQIGDALAILADKGRDECYKELLKVVANLNDIEQMIQATPGIDQSIEELTAYKIQLEERILKGQEANKFIKAAMIPITFQGLDPGAE
jgi:hypothetical protein